MPLSSEHYSKIGKIGGSRKGIKKGFAAMDKEKALAASRRGGRRSKPSHKKKTKQ